MDTSDVDPENRLYREPGAGRGERRRVEADWVALNREMKRRPVTPRSVLYVRVTKLFDELALAHGEGSFSRRLESLAAADPP